MDLEKFLETHKDDKLVMQTIKIITEEIKTHKQDEIIPSLAMTLAIFNRFVIDRNLNAEFNEYLSELMVDLKNQDAI